MKTLKRLVEELVAPVGVNGFCILKPEFTKYEDEFCTLLNNNDWKIVKKVKKKLSKDDAAKLYISKKDESYYNTLCDYMSSDDCVCCSCSKKCDDPIKDMNSIKDKVRKQWGEDDMKNAMHSSDSLENVERESKLCLEGICESLVIEAKPKDLGLVNIEAQNIIDRLQDAFCEEMNAWYQYYIIAPFLVGKERTNIVKDYYENASEEMSHATKLLERINQLGGTYLAIDSPKEWDKLATHKYIKPSGPNVEQSLQQMIDAEKGAIETYTSLEELTRDKDVVTNTLVKEILADEQKHLQEMIEFLEDVKK